METTKYLNQEERAAVWNAVALWLDDPALWLSRYPDTYAVYEVRRVFVTDVVVNLVVSE